MNGREGLDEYDGRMMLAGYESVFELHQPGLVGRMSTSA